MAPAVAQGFKRKTPTWKDIKSQRKNKTTGLIGIVIES